MPSAMYKSQYLYVEGRIYFDLDCKENTHGYVLLRPLLTNFGISARKWAV